MRYRFDGQIMALNGQPIPGKDFQLSSALAETLVGGNEGPAVKLLCLGVEVYNTGEIELSEEDFQIVRRAVDQSNRITILAKGRLLMALDEQHKAK